MNFSQTAWTDFRHRVKAMLMKPCVLPILNMANAHSPLAVSLPSWRGLLLWALFTQRPYCPERLYKLCFTTLDFAVKNFGVTRDR